MCITLSNIELFGHVKLGLRPSLEDDICSKEIIDLLRKCWSESINERPDFNIINHTMRKTTKYIWAYFYETVFKLNLTTQRVNMCVYFYRISGNILDNLLARMEKYANNLEDLVRERTEACESERQRAETLLYRLLPS